MHRIVRAGSFFQNQKHFHSFIFRPRFLLSSGSQGSARASCSCHRVKAGWHPEPVTGGSQGHIGHVYTGSRRLRYRTICGCLHVRLPALERWRRHFCHEQIPKSKLFCLVTDSSTRWELDEYCKSTKKQTKVEWGHCGRLRAPTLTALGTQIPMNISNSHWLSRSGRLTVAPPTFSPCLEDAGWSNYTLSSQTGVFYGETCKKNPASFGTIITTATTFFSCFRCFGLQ